MCGKTHFSRFCRINNPHFSALRHVFSGVKPLCGTPILAGLCKTAANAVLRLNTLIPGPKYPPATLIQAVARIFRILAGMTSNWMLDGYLIPYGDYDIGLGFFALYVAGSYVSSLDYDGRVVFKPVADLLLEKQYRTAVQLREECLHPCNSLG